MRLLYASSRGFNPTLTDKELKEGGRLGLDSHADVSCIGKHGRILERFSGQTCSVKPFNDSYQPMRNIETVNAAFSYDTMSGQTFILQVNQALNFTKSMEHSLLCPNQSRVHGVIIEDTPPFLDKKGTSSFSVEFPKDKITLPLEMDGAISYLPVRYPTDEELNECTYLELTDGSSEWDPHSLDGLFHASSLSAFQTTFESYSHPLDDLIMFTSLYEQIQEQVNVSAIYHKRVNEYTPERIAELWKIPINHAKLTLQSTTQSAISLNEGILSRRFKPQVHHTRYRQLGGYLGMFASDTFRSHVKSIRGNQYTQLFCNRGNFCKSYPMKNKSHAGHALSRFIHDIGVPNEILTDVQRNFIWDNGELRVGKRKYVCKPPSHIHPGKIMPKGLVV